jgi:uncharacterized membrane protein SpoIIM required for sporulation
MSATDPTSERTRAALSTWLRGRAEDWNQLDQRIARMQRNEKLAVSEAVDAAADYRRVGRDLSLAQQLNAPPSTTGFLARQYASLHQVLTRPVNRPWHDFVALWRAAPPAAAQLRVRIFWVALLFASTAFGGWLIVTLNPGLIGLFASPEMISGTESGRLWTDGLFNVVPPAMLSIQIFTNNILVSLFACCLGVLYGLGTVYIIGMNGFMIGAGFGFTRLYQLDGRLFEFVVAHGIVELSVIAISGAVGISLGEALFRPGNLTRRAAFEAAVRQSASVMLVCVVFLVGAGVIEGFVSPNPGFSLPARIAIGVGYMILFVGALTGAGPRLRELIRDARADAAV